MTQEIVVTVEETPIEIDVDVEDPTTPLNVVVSEVGLVGPSGPPGAVDTALLDAHINSEEPHPVYDDGTSLVLLYSNAKV